MSFLWYFSFEIFDFPLEKLNHMIYWWIYHFWTNKNYTIWIYWSHFLKQIIHKILIFNILKNKYSNKKYFELISGPKMKYLFSLI